SVTVFLCFLFFLVLPVPLTALFPYTSLFRSGALVRAVELAGEVAVGAALIGLHGHHVCRHFSDHARLLSDNDVASIDCRVSFHRSEEHTSELQSRENLVCRLLLEKKKSCTIR